MNTISRIHAREVLDSRGNPTVEVEAYCGAAKGRAIVPAGASTGTAEACELRDGDPRRYDGRGVLKAVAHVNETLAPAIVGLDPRDQATIDSRLCELDGTPQKSRLGANALLGVSLAAAHVAAAAENVPLYRHLNQLWQALPALPGHAQANHAAEPRMPLPMVNMISGGLHAGGNLDFQDFLIIPVGAPRTTKALEWIVTFYHGLGDLLAEEGYEGLLVGDEGGYGPRLTSNRASRRTSSSQPSKRRHLRPGDDVAHRPRRRATHFFDGKHYRLPPPADARLTQRRDDRPVGKMLVDAFPIASIEDGLAEEDWDGWQELTAPLGRPREARRRRSVRHQPPQTAKGR